MDIDTLTIKISDIDSVKLTLIDESKYQLYVKILLSIPLSIKKIKLKLKIQDKALLGQLMSEILDAPQFTDINRLEL